MDELSVGHEVATGIVVSGHLEVLNDDVFLRDGVVLQLLLSASVLGSELGDIWQLAATDMVACHGSGLSLWTGLSLLARAVGLTLLFLSVFCKDGLRAVFRV